MCNLLAVQLCLSGTSPNKFRMASNSSNATILQVSLLHEEGQSRVHSTKITTTTKILLQLKKMKLLLTWSLVIAIIAFAIHYFSLPWIAFPVLWFLSFLASGGPSFPKVFFRTIARDVRAITIFSVMLLRALYYNYRGYNITDLFQKSVKKYSQQTAFQFEGKSWTFQEVDEYSNRVGNFFKSKGFRKGDVVALFMENKPEYVCIWLGLAKIGVITALINFNLRMDSLYHCISVAEAKALIFSSDYSDPVQAIVDKLNNKLQLYSHGQNSNSKVPCISLDQYLKDASTKQPTVDYKKSFSDTLLYIYTSGTTGLPKPAIIRTSRFFLGSGFGYIFNIGNKDVVYCTLPLYHTAGGMVCVSYCFIHGCKMVIRRKFSASRFWDDCIEYKVTIIQYIGELCRYLLAQPYRSSDAQHTVRLAIGNGLRPKIWPEFQSRFKIKQIGEFYGSSEGNANLVNTDNTVGACGFTSIIFPRILPIKLIRIDLKTGEILRGRDGLAIQCTPGEPGVIVGRVIMGSTAFRFDGYLNQKDTAKKLIRDVFSKNDVAFVSGDVAVQDQYGYVFFQDRTGDTFRWRGENVSTAEVESIVSKVVGLRDVVVYGVEVPEAEGKAGMMTIADPENLFHIESLARTLEPVLPSYARPVFVRVVKSVAMTGTFKFQKNQLKEEGFNVNLVQDPIYYLNTKSRDYLPIEHDVYNQILDGRIRF